MTETTDLPSYASMWDQAMYLYLTSHAKNEGRLLEAYLDAATSTHSEAFRYIVNLLADDERRHHRFFNEIAQSLRVDAELAGEQPEVPRLDLHKADREQVQALTRELIDNEEHDARELRRLRKQMKDFEDTTLWALLVEVMQYDTEKHLAILKYVRKHA